MENGLTILLSFYCVLKRFLTIMSPNLDMVYFVPKFSLENLLTYLQHKKLTNIWGNGNGNILKNNAAQDYAH